MQLEEFLTNPGSVRHPLFDETARKLSLRLRLLHRATFTALFWFFILDLDGCQHRNNTHDTSSQMKKEKDWCSLSMRNARLGKNEIELSRRREHLCDDENKTYMINTPHREVTNSELLETHHMADMIMWFFHSNDC